MTAHCAYVLLLEMVSAKYRPFFSAAVNIMDGSANIWLPFYYKYVDSWQYLYIANTVESFALMILIWILVTESPRFLVTIRKFSLARRTYARIARVNRRPMFDAKFQKELLTGDSSPATHTPIVQNKGRLRDLCNPRNKLLLPLLVVPLLWFTVDIVYYGINFGLGHLDGDIYVNGLVSGVSELVGYIISAFIADWIGRKWSTTICYGVGGIGCIMYTFFQDYEYGSYIFLVLGKLGASATFTLVYLITTQMFPTVYRGTVFGIANVCARVGGLIAPLVSQIVGDRYFMLVFGVLGVLSCGGSLMLKETKGRKMEDNLDEAPLDLYITEDENIDKISAADLRKLSSAKDSRGSINNESLEGKESIH